MPGCCLGPGTREEGCFLITHFQWFLLENRCMKSITLEGNLRRTLLSPFAPKWNGMKYNQISTEILGSIQLGKYRPVSVCMEKVHQRCYENIWPDVHAKKVIKGELHTGQESTAKNSGTNFELNWLLERHPNWMSPGGRHLRGMSRNHFQAGSIHSL